MTIYLAGKTCLEGQQLCPDGSACLKEDDKCNGVIDCDDGSDESVIACAGMNMSCPPFCSVRHGLSPFMLFNTLLVSNNVLHIFQLYSMLLMM